MGHSQGHCPGAVLAEALRRSGPVPLATIAPLLHDAATAMDAAVSCHAAPHSLEHAVLEGVNDTGPVDWSAAQMRIALQLTPPPVTPAGLTAAPLHASAAQAKLRAAA